MKRFWLPLGAVVLALGVAGCSGPSGRQAVERKGAAATSNGVRLSPDPAFAASRIDVVFGDPWIDPAKCRFVWRHNGAVIEGAGGSSLEPSHFSKGERVSVEVTLVDPSGRPREMAAAVEVQNTPPKITGATLSLATAGGSAVVQANVQSVDPDGDDVSYTYQWYKNGERIPDGTGPTLSLQRLARGDRVGVEAVAGDGQGTSAPFTSDPLAIDNRPPEFTSQPRVPRSTDKEFRYKADAVDRDGDPVHYELVSAPNGMTLDPSGMIVWPLPAQNQRQPEYPVRIKALDMRGGEAVQEFSVRLDQPAK